MRITKNTAYSKIMDELRDKGTITVPHYKARYLSPMLIAQGIPHRVTCDHKKIEFFNVGTRWHSKVRDRSNDPELDWTFTIEEEFFKMAKPIDKIGDHDPTHVLTADGCEDLPVVAVQYDNAAGLVLVSCWELSKEEIEEIAKTGRIYLGVATPNHPPVWIQGRKSDVFEEEPVNHDVKAAATPDGLEE